MQSLFIVLLLVILLSTGCGNQSSDMTEDGKEKVLKSGPKEGSLPQTDKKESLQKQSLVEVDWGREVYLNEMIEMAREDRIKEIQWHVMPNILRAETSDGNIYHLRNENKGVDLRNTLIDEGVRIGKGGVLFRHVF